MVSRVEKTLILLTLPAVLLTASGATSSADEPAAGLEQWAYSYHKVEELLVSQQTFPPGSMELIPIPVYVEGEGPYNFCLDTGALGGLSPQVAYGLLLPPSITFTSEFPRVNVSYYMLGDIRLPGMKDVEVVDLTKINSKMDWEMHGLFGGAILSQLIVTIDYPHSSVVMYYDNRPAQEEYERYLSAVPDAVVLPLQISEQATFSIYPLVEVTINDEQPVIMLVDTCSGMTVLDRGYARSLGIEPIEGLGGVLTVTFEGTCSFPQSIIERLSVDGRTIEDLPCLLEDAGGWVLREFSDVPVAGILGVNFLSNFKVTFNYSRREMVLE